VQYEYQIHTTSKLCRKPHREDAVVASVAAVEAVADVVVSAAAVTVVAVAAGSASVAVVMPVAAVVDSAIVVVASVVAADSTIAVVVIVAVVAVLVVLVVVVVVMMAVAVDKDPRKTCLIAVLLPLQEAAVDHQPSHLVSTCKSPLHSSDVRCQLTLPAPMWSPRHPMQQSRLSKTRWCWPQTER
jgi:hypothetical protein